jgi:hypothetical protein
MLTELYIKADTMCVLLSPQEEKQDFKRRLQRALVTSSQYLHDHEMANHERAAVGRGIQQVSVSCRHAPVLVEGLICRTNTHGNSDRELLLSSPEVFSAAAQWLLRTVSNAIMAYQHEQAALGKNVPEASAWRVMRENLEAHKEKLRGEVSQELKLVYSFLEYILDLQETDVNLDGKIHSWRLQHSNEVKLHCPDPVSVQLLHSMVGFDAPVILATFDIHAALNKEVCVDPHGQSR